ncbi:GNAT family N-acetyltransferase [Silvimonas iriomotensis]|uniref:N-acetyltransferase domain-containing protein n=1 Tax=Silvimonas iriomotensis TaxID=449662 RepID=A0ABQ2PA16_9NEIS|nr:GNAT family N-acetyltransferase [Silvimonas iriomotensis]GGP22065.1 hypothetical protein GCM10010970_23330 [Silvimonas iriomotensis]
MLSAPGYTIRSARISDAEGIATALIALGVDRYCVPPEQLAPRIEQLTGNDACKVLVAEDSNGVIAGVCHVAGVRNLSTAGYAEIMELSVREDLQRRGIGKTLVAAARAWAMQQQYPRLRLRSGVHRTEAHSFYESCGFTKSRASYAFEAQLSILITQDATSTTWV